MKFSSVFGKQDGFRFFVEMSTVGKSQDPAWKDVLDTKGLSAAAPILEEYGLSCESDMSLVDEEDLVVLCSKLKQFQS